MGYPLNASSLRSSIRRALLIGVQGPWRRVALFLVVVTFLGATRLLAQQPKPSEYQVKATYLYNFGRFVKWPETVPAGKGDSFSVCVLGQDPFGPFSIPLLLVKLWTVNPPCCGELQSRKTLGIAGSCLSVLRKKSI